MNSQIFKFSTAALLLGALGCGAGEMTHRPNILLAISDDQSWPHASVYGYRGVSTPAFDSVAQQGVLFTNAFSASPGCSPARAALLTGRHAWQIEHAGTHASAFPRKYFVYPDLLEEAGYFIGYTGKGWGPGNWAVGGRGRNPAGPSYEEHQAEPSLEGLSRTDYAANFAEFLRQRPQDRPFCFWYGGHEPHRLYRRGSGLEAGKNVGEADVPPFLPDAAEVKSDVLDYCVEIEWFDEHLGDMLKMLDEAGELDNTLVIVTSDNGMPFPRAKANCYEYGIHVPLAISWPARVPGGRRVEDLVGFVDLTATILEAAGVEHPAAGGPLGPSGRSIMKILFSSDSGVVEPSRNAVFAARERHSSSRWRSLSYPIRALRTPGFLYLRNFKPERWPAGAPQKYGRGGYATAQDADVLGSMHGGYHDIDSSPTLTWMIENRDAASVAPLFPAAVDKRPAEELYDVNRDPACLDNLADKPEYAATKQQLAKQLMDYLEKTGDPRVTGNGDVWETYPRYSPLRQFPKPDWAMQHPEAVPDQPWLRDHLAKQPHRPER